MKNTRPSRRTVLGCLGTQRGAISPFLFGLLAGVAIFSGTMKAKSELALQRIKEEQAQRERETAEQYKRAIEGSILSETTATYGTMDRERVEQNLAKGIGGGTRAGQDVAFGSITTDATRNEQRIIISTSDDDFVRTEVSNIETAADAGAAAESDINRRGDIANINTAPLRIRQVKRTLENMHKESELIYAFWGRNAAMPTVTEYNTEINSETGLTDFWGSSFTYSRLGNNYATLEATTPWGQTLVVPMDLGPPEWRVFVTSGTWKGNLGGAIGADQKCQIAADNSGLRGTYMAWLSIGTGQPPNSRFANVGTAHPFVRIDGVKIADNWGDLTGGSILNSIDITENGTLKGTNVWTNVDADGTASTPGGDCTDWTSTSTFEIGASGTNLSNFGDDWTRGPDITRCGLNLSLYCFQTEF